MRQDLAAPADHDDGLPRYLLPRRGVYGDAQGQPAPAGARIEIHLDRRRRRPAQCALELGGGDDGACRAPWSAQLDGLVRLCLRTVTLAGKRCRRRADPPGYESRGGLRVTDGVRCRAEHESSPAAGGDEVGHPGLAHLARQVTRGRDHIPAAVGKRDIRPAEARCLVRGVLARTVRKVADGRGARRAHGHQLPLLIHQVSSVAGSDRKVVALQGADLFQRHQVASVRSRGTEHPAGLLLEHHQAVTVGEGDPGRPGC